MVSRKNRVGWETVNLPNFYFGIRVGVKRMVAGVGCSITKHGREVS